MSEFDLIVYGATGFTGRLIAEYINNTHPDRKWAMAGRSADKLAAVRDEMGLTILITEQNANFAMTLAERLYVLEAGAVRATGTVDELRNDPRLLEAYFGH